MKQIELLDLLQKNIIRTYWEYRYKAKKAVPSYLKNNQLLHFSFAGYYSAQ